MTRPTSHWFCRTSAVFICSAVVLTTTARAQPAPAPPLAAPAPAAAATATAPATTQATTQAAEDEAAETLASRRQREEELKRLPVVRVERLRDVVHFAIENDDLIVRTAVPPTEAAAVAIDGKPTLITVMSQRADVPGAAPAPAGADADLYQPPIFSLVRHEYPESGGLAITHIYAVAPRVQVSSSSQRDGHFRNVDFIQSDDFLEESEDRVRLYAQEERPGEPMVEVKISAPNISELRRKYPTETMRYLEPIFRDYGQAGVLFQVSPEAAWQVLGQGVEPPAEVVQQVDALLEQLDAEDAKQRDAAARELKELGQPAALVLMRRDRTKLSEEQQARVETFLAPYKPMSDEEAQRMRSDVEFLLTVLSTDQAALSDRALARLKEVTGQPITFDARAAGPARAEAIAALRARLLPSSTQPATTTRSSPDQPEPPRPAP